MLHVIMRTSRLAITAQDRLPVDVNVPLALKPTLRYVGAANRSGVLITPSHGPNYALDRWKPHH